MPEPLTEAELSEMRSGLRNPGTSGQIRRWLATVDAANQRAEQAEAERDAAYSVIRRLRDGWVPNADRRIWFQWGEGRGYIARHEPAADAEVAVMNEDYRRALVADQPDTPGRDVQ